MRVQVVNANITFKNYCKSRNMQIPTDITGSLKNKSTKDIFQKQNALK